MIVCSYDCMCRLIMCPSKPKCTEVNNKPHDYKMMKSCVLVLHFCLYCIGVTEVNNSLIIYFTSLLKLK